MPRNHSRSETVDLLPGSTTRSASAIRDGSLTHRTATPGSHASASTSVEFETRGSRIAATRNHSRPTGGAGPADGRVGHRAQRVLRVQPQLRLERHDAKRRASGQLCKLPQAGFQQRLVTAELVDHESCDQRLVLRIEHRHRPEQVREHPTPVDVADHQHRQPRRARQPHVRQVCCTQVDLRRRPCTLADHDVEFLTQGGELVGHHRTQRLSVRDVVRRTDSRHRLPAHHQLRASVAAGLEQHRVEAHARLEPARGGLQRLRPPDLAAVEGDDGVVGHVLRLERRHRQPAPRKQPAQPRDQHALTRIRGTAGDEQGAPQRQRRASEATGDHGSVRISDPLSVTTRVCSNCAVHLRSFVTTVQPSSQIS